VARSQVLQEVKRMTNATNIIQARMVNINLFIVKMTPLLCAYGAGEISDQRKCKTPTQYLEGHYFSSALKTYPLVELAM